MTFYLYLVIIKINHYPGTKILRILRRSAAKLQVRESPGPAVGASETGVYPTDDLRQFSTCARQDARETEGQATGYYGAGLYVLIGFILHDL